MNTENTQDWVNVAHRLTLQAQARPDEVALAEPLGYGANGKRQYRSLTFRELDEDSDRIAAGLKRMGVKRGTRIAILIPQSIEFVSIVFGLYKSGATTILIDPGMGPKRMLQCLADADPEGFIAIPKAHVIRKVMRLKGWCPNAKLNVTVGRRLFWGGPTLKQFRAASHEGPCTEHTGPDDQAAIIFTSGSTGPAKGVGYSHRNFDTQVEEIQGRYDIQPGEVDVPGFPLFGLFSCAMGVTSIIPDMDPTRPANVDPKKYLEAIDDWKATQSFASPALWNKVSLYCEANDIHIKTLRRVVTAGAPVPYSVLERMKRHLHEEADLHTPYGATESLPVASISASEVLSETWRKTAEGGGVCVGRRFPKIEWRIIPITDEPIEKLEDVNALPNGEIGEIAVCGSVVTKLYVTRVDANATAKMIDAQGRTWHRMGDVGLIDNQDRFWFHGRKAHRLRTENGPMFTIPCEAIFNQHEKVFRSALVGVGKPGEQRPVLIVEMLPDVQLDSKADRDQLKTELERIASSNDLTLSIETFMVHPSFPVDIRHNAKIFREKLTVWATEELAGSGNAVL
jgi:olefin beta-lactone synthetase